MTEGKTILKDCYKTYRYDQDKVRNPRDTLEWVTERLARVNLKILSKTLRIDTGRLDIPIYISLCGEDATRLTGTKKQMGKGSTPEQSQASAIMELVERFSFFSHINQHPFALYRYREMPYQALSPAALQLSIHDQVTPLALCQDFVQDFPMRWSPAYSLTRNETVWIPIDWFYLINEYNGPAAGNTLEEAVLQSLCEVVERHVGSIISFEERSTPCIDPHSVQDPAAMELIRKFSARGIRLFLRDFSLNTGIPSVGALAYDPGTFPEQSEIVFTAGTTSHPEKSLSRALTEIAQLAGDFENRTSYRPTLPKYAHLEHAAYLMETDGAIPIHHLPNLADDNLKVEIDRCVAALARIGLEVLVVDVTHPELGIPTVYTIIPGAHFLDRTRHTDFAQHAARTLLRGLPPEQVKSEMERLYGAFGPRYDLTFFLAHSLELEGQPQLALKFFQKALEEQPEPQEIASIYVHIGSCHKELGEFHQALENLAIARQHNPELKEIYNLEGFCHYQLKQHHEAIAAFEKAIELDPGSAIDYANIGSNLRELGCTEEAIRLYEMALELDPDIDFARENAQKLKAILQQANGS